MKTILEIGFCMAVLCGILGLLMCVASSMVSQAEEKYNIKHREENGT